MSEASAPRPPSPPTAHAQISKGKAPLTREQRERIELNRLKAKALFEQRQKRQAASQFSAAKDPTEITTGTSTSQKRSHDAISGGGRDTSALSRNPCNSRNGRTLPNVSSGPSGTNSTRRKKPSSYVEYDLSLMTDTKGGFLSPHDDPLSTVDTTNKPLNMTLQAWSQHLLRQKLASSKQGAFEPHLSALDKDKDGAEQKKCHECGSWELDWVFLETFKCRVCAACKEKLPDKYSLLTKTECKEDYLITDPELKDTTILPHLTKPNPHKSTWNDMQLFLRYQVEERALAKWGSWEKLDAEFERREQGKKSKKEKAWKKKMGELRDRTRLEAWKRKAGARGEGRGSENRDTSIVGGRHVHNWGLPVDKGDGSGMEVRTCEGCGAEVEELVL